MLSDGIERTSDRPRLGPECGSAGDEEEIETMASNGRAAEATGVTQAAIYVRVSSAKQEDDGTSLVTQESRCRAYAAERGYAVEDARVYREVHTGAEWRERPRLADLRSAVRRGDVDVVVAYAVDRLSRKQAHLAIVADELEQAGVRLEFVTERFEDTAVGEFIRNAKAFAAEIEREKIAERTVRGRIERVKSGKLIPGGKPLYGYIWKDQGKGQLVEDPATASVVRRLFTDAAAGTPLRRIVADLNYKGIPTPMGQGRFWYVSTVAKILHKPAYKGEAYGWGIRKAGTQPQTFDPARAIRLPDGTIPALTDAMTWEAVQGILARNKARSVRSAKHPESALLRGGYVRCGYCGHTLRARPCADGGAEYACNLSTHQPGACGKHTIRASILDTAVWGRALSILTDPSVVAREVDRLRGADPTAEDLATVNRALVQVERQRANLARVAAMVDDPEAAAPVVTQLQALTERDRQLRAEREGIEWRRKAWCDVQTDLDGLDQWCKTVGVNAGTLTYQQKRLALDALGFSVTLYRADHDPRYVITATIKSPLVSPAT